MKKMLDPVTAMQGVAEAEELMRLAPSAANGVKPADAELPFLEYFNNHCAEPVNGLNHIINTLALAGGFLHYFSDPANIAALPILANPSAKPMDAALVKRLAFKPASASPDQWSEILLIGALLHDLGKTLTHRREIFNCAQHANKGYMLFHETMRPGPDYKKPGSLLKSAPEQADFYDFLCANGFSVPQQQIEILNAVQALILFHDRLGVWQTGESGERSALEAVAAFESLAVEYSFDYQKLVFTWFVLTLSDMMASIPAPPAFPNPTKPHPIKSAGSLVSTAVSAPAAYALLKDFLSGWKGAEMIRLLPALLEPDYSAFDADASADGRFFRMLTNALRSIPAASTVFNLPNAEAFILSEIKKCRDVRHRDPALKDLFDKYGVWDYALGMFGEPLYTPLAVNILYKLNDIRPSASSKKYLAKLIDRSVELLATSFIGIKKFNIADDPIISLEFKNHEYPTPFISPAPELI